MKNYIVKRRYICEDTYCVEAKNKKDAVYIDNMPPIGVNTTIIKYYKTTAVKI